jgi:hypothetical protein
MIDELKTTTTFLLSRAHFISAVSVVAVVSHRSALVLKAAWGLLREGCCLFGCFATMVMMDVIHGRSSSSLRVMAIGEVGSIIILDAILSSPYDYSSRWKAVVLAKGLVVPISLGAIDLVYRGQ